MAHAVLPLKKKSFDTPPSRPKSPGRGNSSHNVLPFHSAVTTKAEALKLLHKFAVRSVVPLGRLRAELIPDSSWKRAGDVLRPTASQTIARLASALSFATRTWQNEPDAIDWLLGPHMELGGATPFSMLRTESGGRAVESVMAALEYGFPA